MPKLTYPISDIWSRKKSIFSRGLRALGDDYRLCLNTSHPLSLGSIAYKNSQAMQELLKIYSGFNWAQKFGWTVYSMEFALTNNFLGFASFFKTNLNNYLNLEPIIEHAPGTFTQIVPAVTINSYFWTHHSIYIDFNDVFDDQIWSTLFYITPPTRVKNFISRTNEPYRTKSWHFSDWYSWGLKQQIYTIELFAWSEWGNLSTVTSLTFDLSTEGHYP